ncbi:MAG: terpene cyclase/mutase family protein [Planctomycetes bacterium]|nr:terpene cyclase/mutase family protein [Planctomycetota bacterium]
MKNLDVYLGFGIWLLVLIGTLISDEITKPTPEEAQKKLIKTAAEKGLKWLAEHQNENGSWTCRIGCKLNEGYIGKETNDNIAVTALGGMSFLAQGSTPGRGKYGDNVKRTLEFILDSCRESDGYITRYGTRMYEHAFATMFLAEIYGMSPRDDVKTKLKNAVNLIVQCQNKDGGWRYQPSPIDADISVTVTTLQALRAARNVGIAVPKNVIEKAMKYVHDSANTAEGPLKGSFKYQLDADARTSQALTAAGVVALMSAGDYSSAKVIQGLNWILTNQQYPIPVPENNHYPYHFYYTHYYLSQALYQAGEKQWKQYTDIMLPGVLGGQKDDGHWEDDVGETYATSMATLILQLPSEYLPIFSK